MINDRAIKRKEEDVLGRYPFVEKLSKALYDWREEESLVISLTGKWGTGKSSIINLVKEYIEEDKLDEKPTVIDFNPWMFSNIHNLSSQFFNELAKELNIKNDSEKDKQLAKKISLYSDLLNIFPSTKQIFSLSSLLTMILGILGVSLSKLIDIFNISETAIQGTFYILGIVSLLAGLLKQVSNILIKKVDVKKKSISGIKNDISDIMKKRDKKLVIIIDDIDRLTPEEVKEMFKLVRVNADFPNTIYVLAYDREIIEKCINIKDITDGKSYIDKIVQVNFDIPRISHNKIANYLFQELNRVLSLLPKSYEDYFEIEYWSKTYHSGYKLLFKTLRDVKRYISSLEFNLSLMCKKGSIEVNPIDFIAIEAIRVFSSVFYGQLKNQKELFTMGKSELFDLLGDESKRKMTIRLSP
ncbi:MAG: KAP family NTPase [Candidatus Cloacimonetes bacterium]|nr:KAP family NTPase [Candidatus Cloacimonadota bacterium]